MCATTSVSDCAAAHTGSYHAQAVHFVQCSVQCTKFSGLCMKTNLRVMGKVIDSFWLQCSSVDVDVLENGVHPTLSTMIE